MQALCVSAPENHLRSVWRAARRSPWGTCGLASLFLSLLSVLAGVPLLADEPVAGTTAAGTTAAGQAGGQDVEAAPDNSPIQRYQLRHEFAVGEQIRWKVIHLVTVETKIQGVTQTAKTRSVSTKCWKISHVDSQGNFTLVHTVEQVDMWQNVTGRQEIRYNSATDSRPPAEYEHVAKSIGQALATITIDPQGNVLKRENAQPHFNPGIGELTLPLPEQAVRAGDQWAIPEELTVRLPDNLTKRIKTRQLYTLVKVETGVATISVETQVLTPVDDPKVKSQLIQRLTRGTIKFDLDAGRVLSKQMDLDETVIAFNGPESIMQYQARFSEELLPAESSQAAATARSQQHGQQPAIPPSAAANAEVSNTANASPFRLDRAERPIFRR